MFCFFCSSLTFLLNIIWAIHQELFFMSILIKFAKLKKKKKKNPALELFWKSRWHKHPHLLKCNPTISFILEITVIIFWGIFRNSYYIESLQITDKFCSSPLMIFQKWLTYNHKHSYKKWKDISSSLHFLSPWISYTLCVYITFIAQYSNILHPS